MIIPRGQGRRGIFFLKVIELLIFLTVAKSVTIFGNYLCKQVFIFIIVSGF